MDKQPLQLLAYARRFYRWLGLREINRRLLPSGHFVLLAANESTKVQISLTDVFRSAVFQGVARDKVRPVVRVLVFHWVEPISRNQRTNQVRIPTVPRMI